MYAKLAAETSIKSAAGATPTVKELLAALAP